LWNTESEKRGLKSRRRRRWWGLGMVVLVTIEERGKIHNRTPRGLPLDEFVRGEKGHIPSSVVKRK